MARRDILPASLPPRGLRRELAAAYLDIGTTQFDRYVKLGTFPKPKLIGGCKVWDRHALDLAFAALPEEGEVHPWDA